MQTADAKTHLKALNDQLKAAAAAGDQKAKEHIAAALSHAQAAKAELQANLETKRASNAASLQKSLAKLDEATTAAKDALNAKGAEANDRLKASIAAAKAALAE